MRSERGGYKIFLKVQPGASENKIVKEKGGFLKVKVTSPPVKGKANKECLRVLAEWLGVKISQIEIERGKTSRIKKVLIKGDVKKLTEKLKNL